MHTWRLCVSVLNTIWVMVIMAADTGIVRKHERSGGNSAALFGVCEDWPVLFSCNGQCRKKPLVYKFCQSPHTPTCTNTRSADGQHFQPTQCTQTHSHTHAVPKHEFRSSFMHIYFQALLWSLTSSVNNKTEIITHFKYLSFSRL